MRWIMNNCLKLIDLENLRYNLKTIKAKLSRSIKLCAVIKDNAYGHGVNNVLGTIVCYADYLAVATVQEGCAVRKQTDLPILILGEFEKDNLDQILENNLEVTISDIEELQYLTDKLKTRSIGVHLAIDSGMHRLGFDDKKQFKQALKIILKNTNIILKGIFTHIGDANNSVRTNQQKANFDEYYALLPSTMHPLVHVANSDTMHFYNTMHYSMVRVGISLYGYGENKELKPVMSVVAKIVHITTLKSDSFVGYGSEHILKKGTTLATLAIGYGQGFMRTNQKFGSVIINGKLCKIVANVCMDMTIVDISNAKCEVGDYAIIMGAQGIHKLDVNLLSTLNNTIPDEILTNFNLIKNSILLHS